MPRSRRQRSVIVLLLTVCLLLQQVAMSALACTLPVLPSATALAATASPRMAPECLAAMSGKQSRPDGRVACEKHCSPDATSASTTSIPPVPALALPPVLNALALAPATQHCNYAKGALFSRSDPPARLRYCRLLI